MVIFPEIRSLAHAHVTGLAYVFSELYDDIMDTLKIEEHVPPPLDVLNVEKASISCAGSSNTFSYAYQDRSIMSRNDHLQLRKNWNLTMEDKIRTECKNKQPLAENAEAQNEQTNVL